MGSWIYLGTGLLSLANGAIMFTVNPGRTINRVFFFASAWIALWFFCVFMAIREGSFYSGGPADKILFWLRLNSMVAAFLAWIVWLMRSVLLEAGHSINRIFYRSWPWLGFSCMVALLALSDMFFSPGSTPLRAKRGPAYFVYMASLATGCLILLADTLRQMRALTGARRIEMQFFVFNTLCACLLVIVVNLLGDLLNILWLRRVGPIAFIAMHGLTVWAICSHRFFDARQVMSSIAQRAIFLCALAGSAVIIIISLNGWVSNSLSVLTAAVATGLLAIVLERPTRRWFGLDLEHRLQLPRRTIIGLSRHEADVEKLKECFKDLLGEWNQTDRVELLFRNVEGHIGLDMSLPANWPGLTALCKNGWITPELLQRKRPDPTTDCCVSWMAENKCGALLAVPRGSDHPSMLLALGQKHSLRPYTYPDIQLVTNLAELMDNILTHASLSQHAAKIAQMEAAALMSRSLAHDLNNLTMPVAAYLLFSEGRAKAGTAEAEVYDTALHSVKVMNDYIRESLFFSRRLTPDFRMLSPNEGLLSVRRLTQERAARRNLTLAFRCEEGIRFFADAALFQRLALNLVNNAIDASPSNASVTVSVGSRNSEQIYLRVEDQGSGIPAENLKRIFEPYFTTKNTGDMGRGLGLGLAICRKILDLHGGEMEVESVHGKGAVFIATFPLHRPLSEEFPESKDAPIDSLSVAKTRTAVGLA